MTSLGATDTTLSALTTGTASLEVGGPSIPRDIELPFVQTFEPQKQYMISMQSGRISTLTSLFESVKFVSLTFAVEVTGQSGKLQFAATPNDYQPQTDTDWLGATVYQRFSGNAHGDTYAEYQFPTRHPFGHELKATSLGNEYPRFYFRFLGSTGDTARVRGCFIIRGGGTGILSAAPLTEIVPRK